MMNDNICANCIHAEVCGWCDSVTQDACDFYEFDGDWIKTDVLQEIRQEIAKIPTDYCGGYIGLDKQKVLEIIDNHLNRN